MKRIELIESFSKRYTSDLNTKLKSILYFQDSSNCYVELSFSDRTEKSLINLDFIGNDLKDDDHRYFKPTVDVEINAIALTNLDDMTIVMCIDDILTTNAIERILDNSQNN